MRQSYVRVLILLLVGYLFILNQGCKQKVDSPIDSVTNLEVISIAKARSLPTGRKTTIQGIVTVASGLFSSSIPFGYAIQDHTGGIYIVDSMPPMQEALEMGQEIEVSGRLKESNGLLYLKEISVIILSNGNDIEPKSVATGAIDESTEGLIVATSGVIQNLENDLPYGYKVFIDDGSGVIDIYVNASTVLIQDTSNWNVGDRISAIGFSSQYGAKYECDVRRPGDIVVISKN